MHFGSVPTLMLAVCKLIRILISANMYGMHPTCVVHQFLKQKVVVSTQERSFGIKVMHEHMFVLLYIAEIIHLMHSGNVPTSILAVFELV